MWCPRSTFIGLFVDDDSSSRWCECYTVIFEITVKDVVAREFEIDAGRLKEIEDKFSLW